jgi:hypothetical protein
VNPDLVVRDEKGEIYTVRYDAVNAMLLNEFLKQHRKMEEQETAMARQRNDYRAAITQLQATIAQQRKEMDLLAAGLKEQASQIQQVGAQIRRSSLGSRCSIFDVPPNDQPGDEQRANQTKHGCAHNIRQIMCAEVHARNGNDKRYRQTR